MRYQGFEIKLSGSHASGYFAEVIDGPGLRRSNPNPINVPFNEVAAWRAGLAYDTTTPGATVTLGRHLFDALFPTEILRLWEGAIGSIAECDSTTALRLRLDIRSPELAMVPWEIIHDGNVHIALTESTPLVRCLWNHRQARVRESSLPLNVLLVTSTPSDSPHLPNVELELESIQKSFLDLKLSGKIGRCDLLTHATRQSLQEQLRQTDYHVVHFIGHGVFDGQNGFLVLEDDKGFSDRLDAETFGYLLGDQVRLLFLNSCETALPAPEDWSRGAAEASLVVGVPAVIAMSHVVMDAAAARFADAFYQALVRAHPIEYCMTEARKAIKTHRSIQWAIPILFTNTQNSLLWRESGPSSGQSPIVEVGKNSINQIGGKNNTAAHVIQINNYGEAKPDPERKPWKSK